MAIGRTNLMKMPAMRTTTDAMIASGCSMDAFLTTYKVSDAEQHPHRQNHPHKHQYKNHFESQRKY